MSIAARFFARPDGALVPLQVAPRLASWMTTSHPDQTRLSMFLDHVEGLVMPILPHVLDPLALRLDVGLARDVALLDHHDLDNYVLPLALRLSNTSGREFASVWAVKSHSKSSAVGVQQAVMRDSPAGGRPLLDVRTSASSTSTAYKEQIDAQLAGVDPLPEEPVLLELAFTVGPGRNWVNLWKPTIDALDALLGRTVPDRRWHPRDGRVVELGLHRHVDAALGHDVLIAVSAEAI